jgi:hypothetical protein
MEIILSSPRKGRLLVVGRRDGEDVFRDVMSPDKQAERKRIVGETGLTERQLLAAAATFDKDIAANPIVIQTATGPGAFTCTRRHINASAGTEYAGPPAQAFMDALDSSNPDEVIEWAGASRLAILDVDYHGRATPPREQVLNAAARLQPQPWLVWLSKGGGLHCVYHEAAGFGADELAACAGLAYLGIDPTATFEVISRTRTPPGEVMKRTQTADLAAVAAWLRTDVSEEQADEWLAERGLNRGEAYPHDLCPMLPGVESHGTPLFVGDGGLFCHKCESLGFRCGSRRPGYFPYAALLHGGTSSAIRAMGENFTHFEHARLVLADVGGLRGATAELAYKSLLKLLHGPDDPRIARVFTAGNDLVRLNSRWGTRDASAAYDKNIQPILAALPACQNAEGKPNAERVSRFTQNIDLTEYGYPAVTPIRGLRIYSHNLAFADVNRVSVVVPAGLLRPAAMERYRPRYVPVSRRVADPWAVVEQHLPGVNRDYVRLLIAAKGVAEGQVGIAPNLLVCGPTGAGKTLMTELAAAICGDQCTTVPWNRSVERFRQGVSAGADAGSFVMVDEIFKDAKRGDRTAMQALDVFLTLTPGSVSHQLYVGPVPLGKLPVCILADVNVPHALSADAQLARRFCYVRLRDSHLEWQEKLASTGLHRVENFRTMGEKYAAAADAIVSEVIDTFFSRPMSLGEIATQLGYGMLTDSVDFEDPTAELKRFYEAVCAAPEPGESYKRRWAGAGWKVIQLGDETPIAEAWEAVCNLPNDGDWYTSRRCDEQDWRKLLEKKGEVRFEQRRFRNVIAVRFRSGTDDKVNGEMT